MSPDLKEAFKKYIYTDLLHPQNEILTAYFCTVAKETPLLQSTTYFWLVKYLCMYKMSMNTPVDFFVSVISWKNIHQMASRGRVSTSQEQQGASL